jgi:hypothetical protein
MLDQIADLQRLIRDHIVGTDELDGSLEVKAAPLAANRLMALRQFLERFLAARNILSVGLHALASA